MNSRTTLVAVVFAALAAPAMGEPLLVGPTANQRDACKLIMSIIDQAITSPTPMDRNGLILDKLLTALDPRKVYFLVGDVAVFRGRSSMLERDLRSGDLSLAYEVYDVYRLRVRQRCATAIASLDALAADPTVLEVPASPRDLPFCATRAEADERLRRSLLLQLATQRLPDETLQQHQERTANRLRRVAKTAGAYDDEQLLSVFFNAVVQSYDPHAAYWSPTELEAFNS